MENVEETVGVTFKATEVGLDNSDGVSTVVVD